ncbi:hypothetical protein CP533_4845 [Ophiocordyceps camponoti-saundersi (nom. inval.)]|nr:hypothetical protein CP533_4845 [Ophiocordyceps camponoti-saundersi (nom. inval.)]
MSTRKKTNLNEETHPSPPQSSTDTSKTQTSSSAQPVQSSSSKGDEPATRSEVGQGHASANGSDRAQPTKKRDSSALDNPASNGSRKVKLKVGPANKYTVEAYVKQMAQQTQQAAAIKAFQTSEQMSRPAAQTLQPVVQTPQTAVRKAVQTSAQMSQPTVQTPQPVMLETSVRKAVQTSVQAPQPATNQTSKVSGKMPHPAAKTSQPWVPTPQPTAQTRQPTIQTPQPMMQQNQLPMMQQAPQPMMPMMQNPQAMMPMMPSPQPMMSTPQQMMPMMQTPMPAANGVRYSTAAPSTTNLPTAPDPMATAYSNTYPAQFPNDPTTPWSHNLANAFSHGPSAPPSTITLPTTEPRPHPTTGAINPNILSLSPNWEQQRPTLIKMRATQLLVESGLAVSHSTLTSTDLLHAERLVFYLWMKIGQSCTLPEMVMNQLGKTELAGYNAGKSITEFRRTSNSTVG